MVGKTPQPPIPKPERVAYAYATLIDSEARLIQNQSTLATDDLVKLGRVLVESGHVSHLAYVVLQRLVTPASRTQEERKRLGALFKRAAEEIDKNHKTPKERQERIDFIREMGNVVRGTKASLNFFSFLQNESPEVLKAFATVEDLERKYLGSGNRSQPLAMPRAAIIREPTRRSLQTRKQQPRRPTR